MIVAGVLSVGPWIAVDSQWRGFSIAELGVPLGPKDPWCSQSYSREWHEMKWHQINWGGSMAYDIVVLVLVILRLQQLPKVEKHSNSIDMRTYILKSNLGYFLVSFAINFASFIAQMTVTNIDIAVSISKNSKFLPDPTADRPFFFLSPQKQMPTPLAFTLSPIIAARVIFQTSEHSPAPSSTSPSFGNTLHQIRKGFRSHGTSGTSGKALVSHNESQPQVYQTDRDADSFTERKNDSLIHGTPRSNWSPEAAKNSGTFDTTEELALSEMNIGWRPEVQVETHVHTSPKFN